MANAILDELKAGLREGGPDFHADPVKTRADMEELLATMPAAEGLTFEDVTLGGLPTVRGSDADADDSKALLYLHGGAYVIGSAKGYRGLSGELGRAAGAISYSPEYRLAPEHPCPAAVEDAVAAYKGLLDQGLTPENIVFAGDSAGGGLALAALVSIRDAGLPQPAAAFLLSPWVDMACEAPSFASKADADPIIDARGLKAMAAHYLNGQDPKNPIASPLFADLSGIAPIMIQVGSSETLLSDSVRISGALGEANTPVMLEIWPEMFHVWQSFHFMLPEAKAAINRAGTLLRERLGERKA